MTEAIFPSTSTDPNSKLSQFTFSAPHAASASLRPLISYELYQIFTPDNLTQANVQYGYDTLNRIATVSDAVAIQTGTRGPYNFLIADGTRGERDDPLFQPYTVVYDTYGHSARYIDEVGHETDSLFDSRSRPLQYVYPEGDCEAFAYDDHNNQTDLWKVDTASACNKAASSTHVLHASAAYNQTWNKPSSVIDARGNTTTLAYYASGSGASLLQTATRPAIAEGTPVYSFAYTALGKIDIATSPTSVVTKSTYASNGNQLSTIVDYATTGGHLNLTTSFLYDANGDVSSSTDPDGNVTGFKYDKDRRKTETDHYSSPTLLNAAEQTIYDDAGRDQEDDAATAFSGTTVTTWQMVKQTAYTPTSKVATVTDADNRTTTTTYDNGDRVLTISDPLTPPRKTHFVYCTTAINCAANQVKTEYRAWVSGTACSQAPPSLQECYRRVTYFPDGEQQTIKDANGNTTIYAYDAFVRLNKTTFPDATFEQLLLDENGNVTQRTNRAGQNLTYQYNALNWVTQKVSPSPADTTSWTYLLDGQIDLLNDTLGNALNYKFDTAGRVTSIATKVPGLANKNVSYVLDDNGNRTKLTWPVTDGSYFAGYCYDNLNRMIAVMENSTDVNCATNLLAGYSYDPLSRRQQVTYGNGASMAYTYTPASDLQTLNHDMTGTSNDPHYTFTYTNAHELLTEANSDADYVWQPSTNASTSYTPNNLNQYTAIGTQTTGGTSCSGAAQGLSYDCNGNLTYDGNLSFTYDAENRLMTASKTGLAAAYQYDPLGRRTRKSGIGVIGTFYLSDGTDEIAEYDGTSGTLTTRYIPGPAIDEPVAMVDGATGAKTYFHTNHQGSVIAMSGAGAALTEGPYTYDPYGNCFLGATQSPCTSSGEPYRFTGRRLDPETGLLYYRARYYDPRTGRFLQTDPVGYSADLNLYTYVGNDPTDKVDPSGNEAVNELQRIDPDFGGSPNNPDPPPNLNNIAAAIDFGSFVASIAEVVETGGAAALGPAEVTETSGHALANEVRAEVRAARTETHHIVPKADRRAMQARENMRANGIKPKTEKTNQVKISSAKHDITKRESYVKSVNDRVADKPDASSIRQECCKIGEELTNSTLGEMNEKYPPK